MKKIKNGCHFINIDQWKIFKLLTSTKFLSLVFRVLTEMEYQCLSLWKNWKMAAISLISIVQKNFKLPTPQSLGLQFSSHQKTRDANFLFSEFSIGSFFLITHPRFHFNIYAWLHLKHLYVDIYASLVYPSSYLCVVLHFLIFLLSSLTLVTICHSMDSKFIG